MKNIELHRPRRAALLAALLAGLAACGDSKTATPEDAAKSAPALVHDKGLLTVPQTSPLRKSVQVVAAGEQVVERPIVVPAAIEADPARLVKVVPPVSGRIVELRKVLGDAVRAGDPLFVLDSADLAQAGSDATKAHAALVLAQHNLRRQTELVQAEIGARKDLEQAESDFAQAKSEAERAQGRLAQLGGGGTGRQYTLRSPLTGRVIELNGARGGFWNDTNAPVMTVADLSTVWVAASVREKDLAAVFVGQAAGITLDAYEDQPVPGKVAYVGEVLDPDTRTVKVRIALDNRVGRYRPGMFAKVSFNGPAHRGVVVPAAAVVQNSFNARVFVETAPWSFQPRVVKVGAQLGDRIEIVDGLKAGERIVVKDGVLLND